MSDCDSDIFLSILPVWHIFERTCEYLFLSRGLTLAYSSLRTFKSDITVRDELLKIVCVYLKFLLL